MCYSNPLYYSGTANITLLYEEALIGIFLWIPHRNELVNIGKIEMRIEEASFGLIRMHAPNKSELDCYSFRIVNLYVFLIIGCEFVVVHLWNN